jgi:hypothetical protein
MTYVHRIKPKGLHFTLISLVRFTIQKDPICRRNKVDENNTNRLQLQLGNSLQL